MGGGRSGRLVLWFVLGALAWASSVLSAAAGEPSTQSQSGVFRAGAAKVDITPRKWPLPMVGTFSLRLAEKAWDPLYVRALVLDDGQTEIAFAVVDSCYLPRSLCDEAKRRIADRVGIAAERVLVSATHTHTAPAARDRREIRADPEYVAQIIDGVVEAVARAHRQLVPAELAWGVVAVPEEVHNRRWFMKPGGIPPNPFGQTTDRVRMNPPRGSPLLDRPAGPVDPDVTFLSVRSQEGWPIALLANYSLHYVGGIPPGGVSADYFGQFARLVEQRLGKSRPAEAPPMVAVMTNGTSGDVNNIDFRHPRPRAKPFERMRAVARRVADAVLQSHESSTFCRDVTLAAAQTLLTLRRRGPSPELVRWAKETLDTPPRRLPHRWTLQYAKWTLQLAEEPETEELVLQAYRVGQVGVAAIPCEVFAEIGLELKRRSPLKPTFTIELANGHYGYLPTPRQHKLGGYETWLGSCILEEQASVKIVDALLQLLETVSTTGADGQVGKAGSR